jgi:ACS family hexuronate transporter-like MFS transporter
MSILRRRVLLALLIVGAVINYADRQIIAILKPLIEVDFHWTDADYGQLASAFQFASAIGLLFAGRFVDRVGIKWANPIAVGAWSAIAMAQALAATFLQFGVMRIALGAAEALGTPVIVKSIATLFAPKERSLAFGGMNAASTGGAIVTPLFVPSVAALFGWRIAFLIVGAAGIVWVGAWIVTARAAELGGNVQQNSLAPRASWRVVIADRRTWAIIGAKALSDQVWWFLLFWAPDLLHRSYHLDLKQIALPLAVIYSCAALGSILGGLGSRQLLLAGMSINGARKLTLLACALLAMPVVLVPTIHREWVTVLLLALTLAAHQGFSANLFSLIADVVPMERLATVTGIGAFSGNLGGMGILAFTGWILMQKGTYGPVFLFAGLSYLLALLWIQLLIPVLKVARESEIPTHGLVHEA